MAAARRAARLTEAAHRRAVEDLEATQQELLLIGIDEPLARTAGALAADLGLRGYDAVHLASALALGSPDTTTLVTWDRDLGEAAHASGCSVAPAL